MPADLNLIKAIIIVGNLVRMHGTPTVTNLFFESPLLFAPVYADASHDICYSCSCKVVISSCFVCFDSLVLIVGT